MQGDEFSMRSEISVSFGFTLHDVDPEAITGLAGISPTYTQKAGERGRHARVPIKVSAWEVRSGLDVTVDLPTQIKVLLTKLEPAWQSLVQLGNRYEAVVNCVVKSYGGDRPSITFDKEIVKRISELNAALDIDLYVLP